MTEAPVTSRRLGHVLAARARTLMSARDFRRGAAVFFVNIAGAAVAAGAQTILARVMGPREFGGYILALNWVMFLLLFARVGFDNVLLRYVAVYRTRGERPRLNGLLREAHVVALGASVLIGAGLAVAGPRVVREAGADIARTFGIAAALLPLLALTQLNKAALVGLKRPVEALLPEQVIRRTVQTALVLILVRAGVRLTAISVLWATVAAAALALAGGVFWLRRALASAPGDSAPRAYETRDWFAMSLPLLVVSTAETVVSRADVLVMGAYRPLGEVGIYGVAVSISQALDFFVSSATLVVSPRIAELNARQAFDDIQRLMTSTVRLLVIATLPVLVGLVLFGRVALQLFGAPYAAGHTALLVLVLAQAAFLFTGPVGSLLSMTGRQGPFAIAMVGTATINLGLALWLVPQYGMVGGAMAALGAAVVRCLALGAISWFRAGVMATPFPAVLIRVVRGVEADG